MNRYLICMIFFLMLVLVSCAEDDEPEWNAAEVCPEAGTNRYGMPNRGTFIDVRDGREYKYTTIGDQVWMAENLNYDAPYSMCASDESVMEQYCSLIEHNCDSKECCVKSWCDRFGRYYSIIEDGEDMGLIDRILVDTICPKGWHVPTKMEWESLNNYMKKPSESGKLASNRLRSSDSSIFVISKNTLNEYNEMRVGTDDCAFSALPAGVLYGRLETFHASFLTSTQRNLSFVWTYEIQLGTSFYQNSDKNSIRCLKD